MYYVCMCVCVWGGLSGAGGRSTTLLAPTWRVSPDKLQRLVLDLTRLMVLEKKPLEVFAGNP